MNPIAPYTARLWKDFPDQTTPIDSVPLNHIEQGIKAVTDAYNGHDHLMADIKDLSIPQNTSDLNNDSGFITQGDIPPIPANTSDLNNDSGFITQSAIPTNVSQLANDSGFITASAIPSSLPASDVYGWAKEPNKPAYTFAEIESKPIGAVWESHEADLRNLNEGYWYPVLIYGIPINFGLRKISVIASLYGSGNPSWAYHDGGFTCDYELLTNGSGWEQKATESILLKDQYRYTTDVKPVGGYLQIKAVDVGVVYLRGGGRYEIFTDFTTTTEVKPDGWTDEWSGKTVTPINYYLGFSEFLTTITAHLNGSASQLNGHSSDYFVAKTDIPRIASGQASFPSGSNSVDVSLSGFSSAPLIVATPYGSSISGLRVAQSNASYFTLASDDGAGKTFNWSAFEN